jgi:hypothetical protein
MHHADGHLRIDVAQRGLDHRSTLVGLGGGPITPSLRQYCIAQSKYSIASAECEAKTSAQIDVNLTDSLRYPARGEAAVADVRRVN